MFQSSPETSPNGSPSLSLGGTSPLNLVVNEHSTPKLSPQYLARESNQYDQTFDNYFNQSPYNVTQGVSFGAQGFSGGNYEQLQLTEDSGIGNLSESYLAGNYPSVSLVDPSASDLGTPEPRYTLEYRPVQTSYPVPGIGAYDSFGTANCLSNAATVGYPYNFPSANAGPVNYGHSTSNSLYATPQPASSLYAPRLHSYLTYGHPGTPDQMVPSPQVSYGPVYASTPNPPNVTLLNPSTSFNPQSPLTFNPYNNSQPKVQTPAPPGNDIKGHLFGSPPQEVLLTDMAPFHRPAVAESQGLVLNFAKQSPVHFESNNQKDLGQNRLPSLAGELFDHVENAGTALPDCRGRTSSKSQHICNFCGKIYSRRYGLKIHLRTHSGYKPLKCERCARTFSDPSNLNKHMKLHLQGETSKNGSKKVPRLSKGQTEQVEDDPDAFVSLPSLATVSKIVTQEPTKLVNHLSNVGDFLCPQVLIVGDEFEERRSPRSDLGTVAEQRGTEHDESDHSQKVSCSFTPTDFNNEALDFSGSVAGHTVDTMFDFSGSVKNNQMNDIDGGCASKRSYDQAFISPESFEAEGFEEIPDVATEFDEETFLLDFATRPAQGTGEVFTTETNAATGQSGFQEDYDQLDAADSENHSSRRGENSPESAGLNLSCTRNNFNMESLVKSEHPEEYLQCTENATPLVAEMPTTLSALAANVTPLQQNFFYTNSLPGSESINFSPQEQSFDNTSFVTNDQNEAALNFGFNFTDFNSENQFTTVDLIADNCSQHDLQDTEGYIYE